jgi:hypothetical protein
MLCGETIVSGRQPAPGSVPARPSPLSPFGYALCVSASAAASFTWTVAPAGSGAATTPLVGYQGLCRDLTGDANTNGTKAEIYNGTGRSGPAPEHEPVLDRALRRGPGLVYGCVQPAQPGTERAGEQLFTVLNRTTLRSSVTVPASLSMPPPAPEGAWLNMTRLPNRCVKVPSW